MAQLDKIRLSGTTYDIIDATAVHSLDGYYTTGETNAAITAATDALAQAIAEQGYQTSGDVQNAISGKANSDDVYTKQETGDLIDEKIAEASGVTTGQVQTMIDESISGKTDKSDAIKNLYFNAYSSGQTSGNNGQLDFKIEKANSTTGSSPDAVAAKDGLYIQRNSYNGADIYVDFNTVAAKSDIPAVSGYADSVTYNSTSKYVEFYHGGTGGTKVFEYDASPFLIDGMVQNVEIKDVTSGSSTVTCLVISFNTDAGKQDINIPLTQIFDASNYYTKSETDAKINQAVSGKVDTSVYTAYTASTQTVLSGKADTTAVTQEISEAVSGKVDTDTYTAYTAATEAVITGKADSSNVVNDATFEGQNGSITSQLQKGGIWRTVKTLISAGTGVSIASNKVISVDTTTIQEKLVNQTNIKSINGTSLLGSGDITVQTLPTVTGTTLVFS